MQPERKVLDATFKFTALFIIFSAVSVVAQILTGGFSADRSNYWDEAAHFVSSLAIADYISVGKLTNPIPFIAEYYSHFPKVAIGHWPPFFELLQAVLFLICGGTAFVALVLQAAIASLCGVVTAFIIDRTYGIVAGGAAGFVVFVSPIFLPMLDLVMSDTLEALLVTLAALCWDRFYKDRNWKWSCLFALTATLSILTKGTALGLIFMPLIYVTVKRDTAFLFNIKSITAALAIAVLTVPWYVATYHMAADGFVYKWGWDYSKLAVPFFFVGLFRIVGVLGAAMYLYGAFNAFIYTQKPNTRSNKGPTTGPNTRPYTRDGFDCLAFVSASLGMIVFAMLAPAYLDLRYLIPALPSIVIVAFFGFYELANVFPWSRAYRGVARTVPALILLSFAVLIMRVPHAQSMHSEPLVKEIMSSHQPNTLILMSGSVKAEGAFISSFAERDKEKLYYIIRAQKALASSSWMTDSYKLKFDSEESMARWIGGSGIGWIVIDVDSKNPNFPHNVLLKRTLDDGLLDAKLIKMVDHDGGQMFLYSLPSVTSPTKISDSVASAMLPGHLGLEK